MKTIEQRQSRSSRVFIVNCEHFSLFVLIVETFAGLILKRQTLLKISSGISYSILSVSKISFELTPSEPWG